MTRHSAAYAKKAAGMAAESKRQAAISRLAEPILEDLKEGTHQLSVEDYRAVAEYLLCGEDDGQKLAKALASNSFTLGVPALGEVFKFWCDPNLANEPTTTLREHSRSSGVAESTLRLKAAQLGLQFRRVGNKKLYLIKELTALCAVISGKG